MVPEVSLCRIVLVLCYLFSVIIKRVDRVKVENIDTKGTLYYNIV